MIDLQLKDSEKAGSCQACHRYSAPSGIQNHQVAEITLKPKDGNSGAIIRLCLPCLDELTSLIISRV